MGERTAEMSGDAALKGSVCHDALEQFVKRAVLIPEDSSLSLPYTFAALESLLPDAYWKLFSHSSNFDECRDMLRNWHDRTPASYWSGRKVVSCEFKTTFELTTPDKSAAVPFTYILDREDVLEDGTIEVIDYKSFSQPIGPELMRTKVQARVYALAMQIKYPDAPRILVTFDLLRYEQVSAYFTREDNIATWKYLQNLFVRILADDGTKETLNGECHWCLRRHKCEALIGHQKVGGPLSITDPNSAAIRLVEVSNARKALAAIETELTDYFMGHLRDSDMLEYEADNGITVYVTAQNKRVVDSTRLAEIIGPEAFSRIGTVTVGKVDALVKSGALPDDQASAVKQAIKKERGNPTIKTKIQKES